MGEVKVEVLIKLVGGIRVWCENRDLQQTETERHYSEGTEGPEISLDMMIVRSSP